MANSCPNHRHALVQGSRTICEQSLAKFKNSKEFLQQKKESPQKASAAFSSSLGSAEGQSGMFRALEQRSAQLAESIYTEQDKKKFLEEKDGLKQTGQKAEAAVQRLEQMKADRARRISALKDPGEIEKMKTEIRAIDGALQDQRETLKIKEKMLKSIETTEVELKETKTKFMAKSKEMGARAMKMENGTLTGGAGGETGPSTILASPNGEPFQGKPTVKLQDAVDQAKPGDTIQLTPGTYKDPVNITGKKDLTIQGMKDANGNPLTKFDGGTTPESVRYTEFPRENGEVHRYVVPNENDFAMVKIKDSQGITVKDVEIKNSWPNGVYIQDSQKITMDGLKVTGSTNAVYAKSTNGNMGTLATKDITIKNTSWNQDPSGKIWTTNDWTEMHHGNQAYYNGALLGGQNVQGKVVVENNTVTNAFNGVRLTCRNTSAAACNQNVSIQNNSFTRIRDNVVEPEVYANGWSVKGNTIIDAHAPFSFDGVSGDMVIDGNRVSTTAKPSLMSVAREPAGELGIMTASAPSAPVDLHNNGKVFKFDSSDKAMNLTISNNQFDQSFDNSTQVFSSAPANVDTKKLCKGAVPASVIWINNTCTGGCPTLVCK